MPLDGMGGDQRDCLLLLQQEFAGKQKLIQRRHRRGNVADTADDARLQYEFGANHGDDDDVEEKREEDADGNGEEEGNNQSDSCESLTTLLDNVVIWLNGEQYWVSGVDADTTCANVICSLLNYQDGQEGAAEGGVDANAISVRNETSHSHNNNCDGNTMTNNAINQSRTTAPPTTTTTADPTDTKELTFPAASEWDNDMAMATTTTTAMSKNKRKKCAKTGMWRGRAAFACEYVIVLQHPHCEEYLDSSAKIVDILPGRDLLARREGALLLRRLAAPQAQPTATPIATTQRVYSGTSTMAAIVADKDSGMGSPSHVGSSRSVRFCRRKHKLSLTWLAQGNTLHPRSAHHSGDNMSAATANAGAGAEMVNERLMQIILAQNATIHRQLSQLKEKECQIAKIEEEKHFVRERELGKNYLLETYLNGLDETAFQLPEVEAGVEIFIDEPYHRMSIGAPPRTKKKTKCTSRNHQPLPSQIQHCHYPHCGALDNLTDEGDDDDGNNDGGGTPLKNAKLVHWLEKVCAINRQLQREEELLLRLHAKIRKHQVRRAYQNKQEVLNQIDELDAQLTLKWADIQCVEGTLAMSNQHLEQKLRVLEQLSELLLLDASRGSDAGSGAGETEPPLLPTMPSEVSKCVALQNREADANTAAELALSSAAPLRLATMPPRTSWQRIETIVDKNVLSKGLGSGCTKTGVKQMFGPRALLGQAAAQLVGSITANATDHEEALPNPVAVVDYCQFSIKKPLPLNVDIARLGTLV